MYIPTCVKYAFYDIIPLVQTKAIMAMHIFNYDSALISLLSPEITSLIALIHEYKGRQNYLLSVNEKAVDALVGVSREKSVVASNRIEGVSTPDYRLRDLFDEDAEPRDEDELAICAYREVLRLFSIAQGSRRR